MRAGIFGKLPVLILFVDLAGAQDAVPFHMGGAEITVPVIARSSPGNPLEISGSAAVREWLGDEGVMFAYGYDIDYVNVSDKTILTLVLSIDVTFSQGHRESNRTEYECFFAPDVIAPGETHSLVRKIGEEITMMPVDTDTQADPFAGVRVLWVQFLDGSTFGPELHGRNIRRIRKRTLDVLQRLEEVYADKGEAEFLRALAKEVEEPSVETLLNNVRYTARKDGAFWAVGKIRRMLQLAREHQEALAQSDKAKPKFH